MKKRTIVAEIREAKSPQPDSVIPLELNKNQSAIIYALWRTGLYGATPAEVAGRLLDEKLQEFLVAPVLRGNKVGLE